MQLRTSKKRASALSGALMLILLSINTYTDNWAPYGLLTIGVPLACRQFLTGRVYDALLSLCISGGLVLVNVYNLEWSVYLPIFFLIAATFILFREFVFSHVKKSME